MLADVGMVKTYSKSEHVNDLGFAWTSPPCCMDRLAPSLHGPVLLLFLEETFLHTLCIDGVFYSRVGEICAA